MKGKDEGKIGKYLYFYFYSGDGFNYKEKQNKSKINNDNIDFRVWENTLNRYLKIKDLFAGLSSRETGCLFWDWIV